MTEATYDGDHAPTPWKAFSQYRADVGGVVHWVEDAIGGVVVPSCTAKDAGLIVASVNGREGAMALLKRAQQALAIWNDPDDGAGLPYWRNAAWKDDVLKTIADIDEAVAAEPVTPEELKPPIDDRQPAADAPAVDVEALGAKARELAAAEGWDGSWDRNALHGSDTPPGPMSKQRWADFTAKALKELQEGK